MEGLGERLPVDRDEVSSLTEFAVPFRYDEPLEDEPLERPRVLEIIEATAAWARTLLPLRLDDVDDLTGPEDFQDDLLDPEDEERFLEEWRAAERHAAEVVRQALASERGKPAPAGVAQAAQAVRAGIGDGVYPLTWVARAAGVGAAPKEPDAELLLVCAAATISPHEQTGLDAEEEATLLSLELADWAGVVIELVREGPGAFARPRDLVAASDRCPEVQGQTAPEDMGLVEAALSIAQLAWVALRLISTDDRLTEVGAWVLPRAVTRAWDVDFDAARPATDAQGS